MQRKKPILSTISIILVAAFSAWLFNGQAAKSVALPQSSSDEPLTGATGSEKANSTVKDTSVWAHNLAKTRNNQDLGSIVARFKGANDCLLYHGAKREVDSILSDEQWNDLSNRTPETLENMDSSSRRSVSVVQQLRALCNDSDERQLILVAREAVFAAALKGSHDAEACFVLFGPAPWQGPGYPVVEPMMDRYLKYAPDFTTKALENGDPIVATRALHRYLSTPPSHPSETDDLPKADPVLIWRAARLASLRAQPQQRTLVERDLTEFAKQKLLSTSDITRADNWAKEAFDRHFSDQAPIDLDFPTQCYSSPSLAP